MKNTFYVKIRKTTILVILRIFTAIALLVAFSNQAATAIENGEKAIDGPVVGITSERSFQILCSGAMIAPRIAITAHHCFPTAGNDPDYLSKDQLLVFQPGSEYNSDTTKRAKVIALVTKKEEWTIGNCAQGFCEDLDDILFLILDQDFSVPNNLRIMTVEDLEKFRISKAPTITYGYGLTSWNSRSSKVPNSLKAYLTEPNPGGFGKFAFNISVDGSSNICAGDSGGPSYVSENGLLYYLGPTSSTRRPSCIKEPIASPGFFGGTALVFRMELLAEAKAKVASRIAEEKAIADAQAIAKAEAEAEEKAKAKIKSDAEAKILAKKKVSIICVKGKVVRKVSGINPKCPSGYIKK